MERKINMSVAANTKKDSLNTGSTAGIQLGSVGAQTQTQQSIGANGIANSKSTTTNAFGMSTSNSTASSFGFGGIQNQQTKSLDMFGAKASVSSSNTLNSGGFSFKENGDILGDKYSFSFKIPVPTLDLGLLKTQTQNIGQSVMNQCNGLIKQASSVTPNSADMAAKLSGLVNEGTKLMDSTQQALRSLGGIKPCDSGAAQAVSNVCSQLASNVSSFVQGASSSMQGSGNLIPKVDLGSMMSGLSQCGDGLKDIASVAANVAMVAISLVGGGGFQM